jgi:hypothetical protein
MSYLQHTRFALMLSGNTFLCAIASLIHAFFPFLFVTHTSTTIRRLQDIFDQREKELAALDKNNCSEAVKSQGNNENLQYSTP